MYLIDKKSMRRNSRMHEHYIYNVYVFLFERDCTAG